jgi:hypothetical protein
MNERFDDIIKEARRKKRQKTIFTIVLNCRPVALSPYRPVALSRCRSNVALSLCRSAFKVLLCFSMLPPYTLICLYI